MNDEIRYPGFRKFYTSGLDGRAIELGKPIDLTYTTINGTIFDLETAEDYGLPDHYIINDGATILFWKDGTKTIVKRAKDEKFDKRLGFLTAYFQKHCGLSKTKANKFLDNLEVKE